VEVLNYETYIVTLRTVYFPPHEFSISWNTHFWFPCLVDLASVVLTDPSLSLTPSLYYIGSSFLTLIESLFEHWQQDYFGFISWLEMIPFGIFTQNSFHKGTKAQGLRPESIELFFWIGTWEHKNCILHIDHMPLGWLQEHHSEGARLFWCEHNRSFYLS
jgi:hypothetical protein